MTSRKIYCANCNEKWTTPELTEGDVWSCEDCLDVDYGIELIEWLQEKVRDTVTVADDEYRFAFRELVQNADDAQATTLVARFRPDALYVANDGTPFRLGTGEDNDFRRVGRIMGRHKAHDATKAGNFGTGFQTTFAFTNTPEIHSNNASLRLDPARIHGEKRAATVAGSPHRSPYGNRGVLFRFAWRDEAAAHEAGRDGRKWFLQGWPRWDSKRRRELYEDLKTYAHDLLLTCQHLRRVRLLWEIDGAEGLQVERDFACRPAEAGSTQRGVVEQSEGEGAYEPDAWRATQSARFPYLIAHGHVHDKEGVIVCAVAQATPDGPQKAIVPHSDMARPERRRLKVPDIWVLLPLFPAKARGDPSRTRWAHSVIPLTLHTSNHFVINAHLFPEESRKDIDIQGPAGEWCKLVRRNLVNLFKSVYPAYVEAVQALPVPAEAQQEILLDHLPATHWRDWLKQLPGDAPDVTPNLRNLVAEILAQPILLTTRGWVAPQDAARARTPAEAKVLDKLGIPRFSGAFLAHERYRYIDQLLAAQSFSETRFQDLWRARVSKHKGAEPSVKLGQKMDDVTLDDEFVHGLLEYALETCQPPLLRCPVVPCKDGFLRNADEIRRPPPNREELAALMPARITPHPDYASYLQAVEDEINQLRLEDAWLLFEGVAEKPPGEVVEPFIALLDHIRGRNEPVIAANLEKRPTLAVFPTAAGGLASRQHVRVPDATFPEQVRSLFKKAKHPVEWVAPEVQARHQETLTRLKLQPPEYKVLLDKLDWGKATDEERIVFVHAVVRSGQHVLLDSTPWLPLRGRLVAPRDALTNTTQSPLLDSWFNVLDEPLRKGLEEYGVLRSLNLKDAANPNVLFERLQERYLADRNRFEDLDDADWRATTALVALLADRMWTPPRGAAASETRFLPVRHLGTLRLVAAPGPRVGRGEDSHRTFPFFRVEGESLHPALEKRLKLVAFHPDVELPDDIHTRVNKTWGVWQLSKVNIVRHLIANYMGGPSDAKVQETSLFDDRALEKFCPEAAPKERRAIKESLLQVVKGYFKAQKGEPGLYREDVEVVPLLYDADRTWRAPRDLLFPDAPIVPPGTYRLHPDFKGWDATTLSRIGVRERLDVETLANGIANAAREPPFPDLKRTLADLLAIDADLKLLVGRVGDMKWIPTTGGDLRAASDALFPTTKSVETLGQTFPGFADLRASPDLRARALRDDADLQQRAQELGMRLTPRLDDLVAAVAAAKAADKAPPPRLFDELEREPALKQRTLSTEERERLGYHADGRWWGADEIFLHKVPKLPARLRGSVILLQRPPHKTYLAQLGVRDSPDVIQLVSWLQQSDLEEAEETWNELVRLQDEISETLKDRVKGVPLAIPPADAKAKPADCILAPDLPKAQLLDRRFVGLPETDSQARTLRRLGAQRIEDIDTATLAHLYDALRAEDESHAPLFRHILGALAARPDVNTLQLTVVVTNPPQSRKPVSEAYWPEPKEVAKLFADDLPFVSAAHAPKGREIAPLLDKLGIRSLRPPHLVEIPPPDLEQVAEDDAAEQERLSKMATALAERAQLDPSTAATTLGWLREVRVRRRSQIFVELRVGARARLQARAYLLAPDAKTLYVPNRGPATFYNDIAHAILRECERRGLAVGSELHEKLLTDIEHMLQWTEWWPLELPSVKDVEFDRGMIITLEPAPSQDLEIRRRLADWYEGCQICGVRTPVNSDFTETEETVRAIISSKGGLYPGPRTTEIGNYFWLCPTHQKYYERKLVKIQLIDKDDASELARAQVELERALDVTKDLKEDELLRIDHVIEVPDAKVVETVEESTVAGGAHRVRSKLQRVSQHRMTFTAGHYLEVLKVLERYLREKGGN